MKNWVWILAIIGIIALISSFYIISENLNPDNVQFPMKTANEQPDTTPEPNSGPSSNAQVSGGASSITQSLETATSNCFQQQIPYALTELKEDQDQGTICKINIKNLDYETPGEFSINFTFLNQNQEKIKNEIVTFTLQTRQEKIFQSETETTNAICEYQTIKIPTKQICY